MAWKAVLNPIAFSWPVEMLHDSAALYKLTIDIDIDI